METRKREEGKEGKKRETTDPKLTIFSQRQLPLMVSREKNLKSEPNLTAVAQLVQKLFHIQGEFPGKS